MEESIEPRFEGNQLIIETCNEVETYDSQFLVAVLLVYVAKADGEIKQTESNRMLQLISEHFSLRSSESLDLLHRAMTDIASNPDLDSLLSSLAPVLSEQDREDVALMMVKVLAADGKADADEMERMRDAGALVGINARTMHNAYDRYFAETQTGS